MVLSLSPTYCTTVLAKGGVEDTRLEAKTKDTKKNPRPRPKTALPRTDPLEAKDRNNRDQGQGPRTQALVFSKKKVFKNVCRRSQKKRSSKKGDIQKRRTKRGLRRFSARFLAFSNKILTIQTIVQSSSQGQGNFRGLEASRPRPRNSKCVLEDVLEAKDVLKNSISGCSHATVVLREGRKRSTPVRKISVLSILTIFFDKTVSDQKLQRNKQPV